MSVLLMVNRENARGGLAVRENGMCGERAPLTLRRFAPQGESE
jgi:hypothetical protein